MQSATAGGEAQRGQTHALQEGIRGLAAARPCAELG